LILGSLDEIRAYVYSNQTDPRPDYWFDQDRQHWWCVNCSDTGPPQNGVLTVKMELPDPYLVGPPGLWQASDVPKVYINAAISSSMNTAQVYWTTFTDPAFSESKKLSFTIVPDGQMRTYEVDLASLSAYTGQITGLRFDPVANGAPGSYMQLASISWRAQRGVLYTLSVQKQGTGSGTVTSNVAGIWCGPTCSASFINGTSVTLVAMPALGSQFNGWSGDVDCSDGVVTMDADKTCTATFVPITPLVIGASSLPAGEVGLGYNSSLGVSGGLPPYTVTIIRGTLPLGLTLGSPTVIGMPTLAGSKKFTIKVTDQLGKSITKKFTLKVLKALSISTTILKNGVLAKSYSATLKVTGGKKPYTWSLPSGNLPAGLTLQSATGKIAGIPTQTGVFNLTFQVTDPLGGQAQKNLTLTIS